MPHTYVTPLLKKTSAALKLRASAHLPLGIAAKRLLTYRQAPSAPSRPRKRDQEDVASSRCLLGHRPLARSLSAVACYAVTCRCGQNSTKVWLGTANDSLAPLAGPKASSLWTRRDCVGLTSPKRVKASSKNSSNSEQRVVRTLPLSKDCLQDCQKTCRQPVKNLSTRLPAIFCQQNC